MLSEKPSNSSLLLFRNLASSVTLKCVSDHRRIPLLQHPLPAPTMQVHSLWESCVSTRWRSSPPALQTNRIGLRKRGATARPGRAGRPVTPRAFLAATDPPEPIRGDSSYESSRDALPLAIVVPPKEVPDTLEKSRTSPPYRQSKDSEQKSLMYEYLHTHIYEIYM